ncbi:MAG: carboxypeptidase-like regulatory domain-containing protein, partial [Polyangiaceae bacterium]
MKRAALGMVAVLVACGGDDLATSSSGAGASGGAGTGNPIGGSTGVTSGSGGLGEPPPSFEVSGVVVDEDGAPIPDAFVLQGGKSHEPPLSTGSDGSFTITLTYPGFGIPGVVAAKEGYRAAGEEFPFDAPDGPVTLVLDQVEDQDNAGYEWLDPGEGFDPTTAFCGHCHEVFAAEWSVSGHSRAAENGKLQNFYAGTSDHADAASCASAGGEWQQGLTPGNPSAPMMKCYLGGGVLGALNGSCGGPAQLRCDDPALPTADEPTDFGACADCHAPGIDGVAGGRNLHDATGFGFEDGVFCDVCHKVSDIDLSLAPGVGGRLILRRPTEPSQAITSDWKPLYFGPLLDVPNAFMGAAYQPDFKEALFCAGCHQQKQAALVPGDALDPARWPDGLDVHSTYEEWLAGPYAASGTPCQFCHMPAHHDMNNTIGTSSPEIASITAGYPRPPEDIRSHRFLGPLDTYEDAPRLIDTALFTSVALSLQGGEVEATVNLSNIGCGHALPTGEPMRALVVRVTAEGTGCGARPATGGDTIWDAGGARRRGVFGADVSGGGTSLTWPGSGAGTGMVVRAVRPTGTFDDYVGIGFFAGPALTP